MHGVSRRDALLGLSGAALMTLGRAIHAQVAARPERPGSDLAEPQRAVIAQLTETIIPETDTPGAIAAGVPAFIALLLDEWCSLDERTAILSGLKELEGASSFVARVQALDEAASEGHWFTRFKYFTVWGYYTSRVGVSAELKADVMPGRYDGDAPYGG